MTKLIALRDDPGHTWFATGGLFDWATQFLLSRVTDPELRERLRLGTLAGYLYLDTVPAPQREVLLRALREELPAAVDRDLYPRPLDLREQQPLMAARLKTLTAMAWSCDEAEARRGDPLVLLLADTVRAEVAHGLQPWLVSLLHERTGLHASTDLRALPDAQREPLLRTLRDDLPPAADAALRELDPAAARWSRVDLRTLGLQAAAVLDS